MAVSDITAVQENASMERLAMQVRMVIEVETMLPSWLRKRYITSCESIERTCGSQPTKETKQQGGKEHVTQQEASLNADPQPQGHVTTESLREVSILSLCIFTVTISKSISATFSKLLTFVLPS